MIATFLLPVILLASITTGDAYSKATVKTEVEGQEVYTRIEVEANGEKKILESSQAGKQEVEVKSSGSPSAKVTVKSIISATPSAEATVSAKLASENVSIGERIKNILDNIVKSLFKIFNFRS